MARSCSGIASTCSTSRSATPARPGLAAGLGARARSSRSSSTTSSARARTRSERVAVWTRELIDAVLRAAARYYLPYQPHATPEQFHRAYPRAQELFALKRELDPEYRLRNMLWDKYYAPTLAAQPSQGAGQRPASPTSSRVFGRTAWQDAFYRFLQNIYRLYPGRPFPHADQGGAARRIASDEAMYRYMQERAPGDQAVPGRPHLRAAVAGEAEARDGAPDADVLSDRRDIDGYVEIGTTGRYVRALRKALRLTGPVMIVNDSAPDATRRWTSSSAGAAQARALRAARQLRADPRGRGRGRERRPRDLLHRPAPQRAGEGRRLRASIAADAAARRHVRAARPRRDLAGNGRVRLARAHGVQRRAAAFPGK